MAKYPSAVVSHKLCFMGRHWANIRRAVVSLPGESYTDIACIRWLLAMDRYTGITPSKS
jgi:hypothetical protein